MSIVVLEKTQASLADFIHGLMPGEEVTIIENNRAVARLVVNRTPPSEPTVKMNRWPCKAGSAKGKIKIAPDFDEPLDEFRDYYE